MRLKAWWSVVCLRGLGGPTSRWAIASTKQFIHWSTSQNMSGEPYKADRSIYSTSVVLSRLLYSTHPVPRLTKRNEMTIPVPGTSH